MKKISLACLFILTSQVMLAQDTVTRMLDYDPDKMKIIPDKVFEFGVPVLFIFVLLNTIVTILKNRGEQQLKMKMLEKGISEETLVTIFGEAGRIAKLQPLKWFLFSAATGIALLIIHFLKSQLVNQSGYLAVGILLSLNAIASLLYYRVLAKK